MEDLVAMEKFLKKLYYWHEFAYSEEYAELVA